MKIWQKPTPDLVILAGFRPLFDQIYGARFEGQFSVQAILPLIQGCRKVENVKRIFIHPIWTRAGNWWPGLSFLTENSSPRAEVSPGVVENDDF